MNRLRHCCAQSNITNCQYNSECSRAYYSYQHIYKGSAFESGAGLPNPIIGHYTNIRHPANK